MGRVKGLAANHMGTIVGGRCSQYLSRINGNGEGDRNTNLAASGMAISIVFMDRRRSLAMGTHLGARAMEVVDPNVPATPIA